MVASWQSMGGPRHQSAAAIDTASSAVTPWAPNVQNGFVTQLIVDGGTVYLGGSFNQVAGQTRVGVAAVDATSGGLSSFDAHLDSVGPYYPTVQAMALAGESLYLTGYITGLFDGGVARNDAVAVDATSGALLPWAAALNAPGNAAVVADGAVYLGGVFTLVNQRTPRVGMAAFDPISGDPTSWVSPYGRNLTVDALAVSQGNAYLEVPASRYYGYYDFEGFPLAGASVGARTWAPIQISSGMTGPPFVAGDTVFLPGGSYYCDCSCGGAGAVSVVDSNRGYSRGTLSWGSSFDNNTYSVLAECPDGMVTVAGYFQFANGLLQQGIAFEACPPTVTTLPAQSPDGGPWALQGSVAANDVATAWFYSGTTPPSGGCDPSLGARLPPDGGVILGPGGGSFSWSTVANPDGGSTFFCAVAQTDARTTWGDVLVFPPVPLDAGSGDSGIPPDAGPIGPDAGPVSDGGVGGTDGGPPDAWSLPGSAAGCGCSSVPSVAWAVPLILGVHRRRRRRV
jgi:hypothetical protein